MTKNKKPNRRNTGAVCIIPARAGSKRIPMKNFKVFWGKPIVEYSLETAQEVQLFDKIILSTDINENELPFDFDKYKVDSRFEIRKRSPSNSEDNATIRDVVLEVIKGMKAKSICVLYPCAPFTMAKDIYSAYDMLDKYNTVFPVIETTIEPNKLLHAKRDRNDLISPCFNDHDSDYREMKKKWGELYQHVSQFFWVRVSHVISNSIISGYCGYQKWEQMKGHDINTEYDWQLAEIKYKYCKENKLI